MFCEDISIPVMMTAQNSWYDHNSKQTFGSVYGARCNFYQTPHFMSSNKSTLLYAWNLISISISYILNCFSTYLLRGRIFLFLLLCLHEVNLIFICSSILYYYFPSYNNVVYYFYVNLKNITYLCDLKFSQQWLWNVHLFVCLTVLYLTKYSGRNLPVLQRNPLPSS